MRLDFKKEPTGEWYIVLPDYHGPKEDLQMVYGADTMLDMISKYKTEVSIDVAVKFEDGNYAYHNLRKLTIPEQFDIGGQWYVLEYINRAYAVWLCDVTKHVFGEFPNIIQFKVL